MARAVCLVVCALLLILLLVLALSEATCTGGISGLAARRGRSRAAEVRGGRAVEPGEGVVWPAPPCHPQGLIAASIAAVRRVPGYGPMAPAALERAAADLTARWRAPITPGQLSSIRSMEVAQAAGHSRRRLERRGGELAGAFAAGATVMDLAARHRLPPVAVLRQVLSAQGRTRGEVRAMMADPAMMPPRLQREVAQIYAADLESPPHARRTRDRAQAFEADVADYLRGLGVVYRTEEDLRAAHVGPSPLLTPDFLMDAPICVHGRPVHWVDAKSYVMYGSPLVARGLEKQAAKYTRAFGPGAMVFKGGLACGAHVSSGTGGDDPLLLDGSHAVPRGFSRAGVAESRGRPGPKR